ncbi:MAG: spore coat protein [Oscillospiraceae bacterium]|nr:spore coat protein [Oscillospiraceae bacterium]
MTDQERLTDLLLTEKKLSTNYDLFASECVNTQLRDTFIQILTAGHGIQSELYQDAQSRGWYKTCPAEANKVTEAYQKFSAVQQ